MNPIEKPLYYVLLVTSEAGEMLEPRLFRTLPDDDQLFAYLKKNWYLSQDMLEQKDCYNGLCGSGLHIEWHEVYESNIEK